MSQYKRLPSSEEGLIEMLEDAFPVKQWKNGDTLENLAYNAGQRSVVEFLKKLKHNGDKNILN